MSIPINPLDDLESILQSERITYQRAEGKRITLDVQGDHGVYPTELLWNGALDALHVLMALDVKIDESVRDLAASVIMHMNRSVWFGHFVINESGQPVFRYTMLFHGLGTSHDTMAIGNVVDDARDICDANQPAFQLMAGTTPENFPRLFDKDGGFAPMALALIDTEGQA